MHSGDVLLEAAGRSVALFALGVAFASIGTTSIVRQHVSRDVRRPFEAFVAHGASKRLCVAVHGPMSFHVAALDERFGTLGTGEWSSSLVDAHVADQMGFACEFLVAKVAGEVFDARMAESMLAH